MSIHANDEFSLRLALESELDDVNPRDGLAGLVIARHQGEDRRRRFAGVFGLFVVFAGIGVPIGVAGASGGGPARPGRAPPRFLHADAARPVPPQRRRGRSLRRGRGPQGSVRREEQAAAVASGVCILMLLAPPVSPGQADPNVPRGAKEVTVGRYRAWLAPRGYAPGGDGAALLIEGGPEGRDLEIGASGLSQAALVSLVWPACPRPEPKAVRLGLAAEQRRHRLPQATLGVLRQAHRTPADVLVGADQDRALLRDLAYPGQS